MKLIYHIERLEKAKELKRLVETLNEVFGEKKHEVADKSQLQKLLKKRGFVAMAAVHGKEIIGGLTAYELPMYTGNRSELFVYDVGVKMEFQRVGVGLALLKELQKYARKKNIALAFVAANEEDSHALDFYRKAGGKAEKVFHFNFELR